MLRAIFVGAIVTVGGLSALRSPFASLLFYLWIAYFRPEAWVWGDWLTSLHLSWWAGLLLVGRFLVSPSGVTWNWRIGLVLLFLVHNALSLGASRVLGVSGRAIHKFCDLARGCVSDHLPGSRCDQVSTGAPRDRAVARS